MNANEAKEITNKALRRQTIEILMNGIFTTIRKAAENGKSFIIVPHDLMNNDIIMKFEEFGYKCTIIPHGPAAPELRIEW